MNMHYGMSSKGGKQLFILYIQIHFYANIIYIYVCVCVLASKSSTEAEGVCVAAALRHKPFSKSVVYIYIYTVYSIDFLRIFDFSIILPFFR